MLRVPFRWASGNGVLSPDPSNPVDLGEGPFSCKRSLPNTRAHEADAVIRAFPMVVGTSLLDAAMLISPSLEAAATCHKVN